MTQRVTIVNSSSETADIIVIDQPDKHNITLRRGEHMTITPPGHSLKIGISSDNTELRAGGKSRYVGGPQVFIVDAPAGRDKGT